MCTAVDHALTRAGAGGGTFRGERSKHSAGEKSQGIGVDVIGAGGGGGLPVPHDEYRSIILVHAPIMMHAVVAGRVEQPLHTGGKLANGFSVNPELVNSIHLMDS